MCGLGALVVQAVAVVEVKARGGPGKTGDLLEITDEGDEEGPILALVRIEPLLRKVMKTEKGSGLIQQLDAAPGHLEVQPHLLPAAAPLGVKEEAVVTEAGRGCHMNK